MKRLLAFLFAYFLHSSLHHESVKAMNEFEVRHFRDVIDRSLQQAKIFLDHEKSQELIVVDGTVPHRYEDKYLLAEQVTKGAAVGVLNSLQAIGMSAQVLTTLQSWSINSSVVLRMEWEESSVFKKAVPHREEAKTALETMLSLGDLVTGRATTKVITTITDYHYEHTVRHRLLAMRGVGAHAEDVLELSSAQGSQEKVYSMQSPSLAFSTSTKEDVDISWLLRMLSTTESGHELSFRISRERASCRTPVRNEEVQAMLSDGRRLSAWNQKLTAMLMLSFHRGEPALDRARLLSAHEKVFVPVTTFFQQTPATAHNHSQPATTAWLPALSSAAVLEAGYLDAFSAEQVRSLADVLADTSAAFPSTSTTTSTHIRMLVIIQHMSAVLHVYEQSVAYLEGMLRAQLTASIGREVQDADMEAYMSYHYTKLYNNEHRPRAFSHAVRRTAEHSPEGSIRLEVQSRAGGGYAPIETWTHSSTSEGLISFAINAATDVQFAGERHVHGWLRHTFSEGLAPVRLAASARQFSSFILLLGRMASADRFDPQHAIIVQNKQDLLIPLLLETIPNAQQFRDAISSLSPEQQRFATAYRAMQLESSLFAVVVLQIKPQLEKVLRLLPDSLIKEIALTQDLMTLFIEHQIPTDLLAYAGNTSNGQERLQQVKQHVASMKDMLAQMKEEQVTEKQAERKYADVRTTQPIGKQLDWDIKLSLGSTKTRAIGDITLTSGSGDTGSVHISSGASTTGNSGSVHIRGGAGEAGGGVELSFGRSSGGAGGHVNRGDSSDDGISVIEEDQSIAYDDYHLESIQQDALLPQAAGSAHEAAAASTRTTRKADKQAIEHPADTSTAPNDFAKYPQLLDKAFDGHSAVRPTIITVGDTWQRTGHKALLATVQSHQLTVKAQHTERQAAFDLLDALTRSGALPLEHAALHVVVAVTHSFADSVMDSLVLRNINPIEDMERTSIVLASTLLGKKPTEMLLQDKHRERLGDNTLMNNATAPVVWM